MGDSMTVEQALRELLTAVLRTDPLRGAHIRYPDLDAAIANAKKVVSGLDADMQPQRRNCQ
jgi:hypothetical protein